jgi:hypothetical protein
MGTPDQVRPCSSAKRRARGLILPEGAAAATGVSGLAEAAAAAGLASAGRAEGSVAFCGRKESTFSPGSPTTNRFVNTGTNVPSSKNRASRVPFAGEATSKVALSVSISATISPTETGSPNCFRHFAIRHSSTVLPSFGTSTGTAIFVRSPRLPGALMKQTNGSDSVSRRLRLAGSSGDWPL